MATNNEESSTPPDEGGYWVGTEKSQNTALRTAASSTLRRSVADIRASHPDAVQSMHDRFPDSGSHELIRFLQARGFDVPKASAMYEAHLGWRKKNLPIPHDAVRKTLSTRKFYLLEKTDQAGRPVLFYCLQRFKEAPYVVEDEIRAFVYLLEEEAMAKMGSSFETQKWTVLIDVSGVRSPPLQFLQEMNRVLEANYPERLFRTVMFPVPFWLQRIIQGCVTFVDKETRDKFAYVNDVKSLEEYAMMPVADMGPDLGDMVKNRQLK